jgi:hypothetical protein
MTTTETTGFHYYFDHNDEDPKYWEALGRFIESFALVEDELSRLLAFYAKVTPSIARAVFSGARSDASMDFIRRVIAVDDPGSEKTEDLEDVFIQLKAISTVRNFLVHYRSIGSGNDRIITDLSRSLTADRARQHRVSTEILTAMIIDLYQIANRLNFHRKSEKRPWAARSSHTRYVLGAAWRYKPPQDHQTKVSKPKRSWPRKAKSPRDPP